MNHILKAKEKEKKKIFFLWGYIFKIQINVFFLKEQENGRSWELKFQELLVLLYKNEKKI